MASSPTIFMNYLPQFAHFSFNIWITFIFDLSFKFEFEPFSNQWEFNNSNRGDVASLADDYYSLIIRALQMVSWRSIWCNSFLRCVCSDPMNFEFMIRSMFLSMKVIWVFWSLICMIIYSLVFILRIFGLVRPTRLIFLSMGRGALWWVRSDGAWSQWQKGNRHVCIVAIKDNKMGSIST